MSRGAHLTKSRPSTVNWQFYDMGRPLDLKWFEIFKDKVLGVVETSDEIENYRFRPNPGIVYATGIDLAEAYSVGHINLDAEDTEQVLGTLMSRGVMNERVALEGLATKFLFIEARNKGQDLWRIIARLKDVDKGSGPIIYSERQAVQQALDLQRDFESRDPKRPLHNMNLGMLACSEDFIRNSSFLKDLNHSLPRKVHLGSVADMSARNYHAS